MVHKTPDKSQVHIRLSSWMANGVDVLSAKLGMTVSDIVRMAVNDMIKKELDSGELALLRDEWPKDQLVKTYIAKGRAVSFSSDNKDSFSEIAAADSESEEDKRRVIEGVVKHFLIDQRMDEWVDQAIKTKENEIVILKQKIRDLQKVGKRKQVKKIEEEVQKIEQLLTTLKMKAHYRGGRESGKLKLGNRNVHTPVNQQK
jgi:antitoxin component of RelBE/YafQ-DinJ toxin-antitoxin module